MQKFRHFWRRKNLTQKGTYVPLTPSHSIMLHFFISVSIIWCPVVGKSYEKLAVPWTCLACLVNRPPAEGVWPSLEGPGRKWVRVKWLRGGDGGGGSSFPPLHSSLLFLPTFSHNIVDKRARSQENTLGLQFVITHIWLSGITKGTWMREEICNIYM